MKPNKPDIESRNDLVVFLRIFYSEAQKNDIIGEKFAHLDMDHHIEIIADFWNSVIFGSNSYHGDPFGKHLGLALKTIDFTTWLNLFTKILNDNYEGRNASEILLRAQTIARVFQHKLNLQ